MPHNEPPRPFPKSRQLARGERRYRRKVASPKQWQAIIAAKIGPCRVCNDPGSNGRMYGRVQMHHIVPRDAPFFGDDTADNIVPLCGYCHSLVTNRETVACHLLCCSLTDAEYAYMIDRAGEGASERIYGVTYGR